MPRNATFDYARFVAACGILWFHAAAPGAGLAYAALPFFLILTVYLSYPAARRADFSSFARDRAQRLLKPFLLWSLIYGGLKLAEVALTPRSFGDEFAWRMLVTGPAIHLWFLPFAFVLCLPLHPLARLWPDTARSSQDSAPQQTAPTVPACLVVATLGALFLTQPTTAPLAQWVFALPPALAGLALALAGARRHAVMVGLLAVAGLGLLAARAGSEQLLVALILIQLCLMCPRPATALSTLAARLSLGVYLAHPLVLSVLDRTLALPAGSLIRALCAVILTGALAMAIDARRSAR